MQETPERRAERLRKEEGTVRCALCPWQATGSMLRVMERAMAHRRRAHPEVPVESNARWRDEPPRREPAPPGPRKERPPSLRDRVVDALRARGGECAAADLAAELGVKPGSVSGALDWARRAGLVKARAMPQRKGNLWRIAGT